MNQVVQHEFSGAYMLPARLNLYVIVIALVVRFTFTNLIAYSQHGAGSSCPLPVVRCGDGDGNCH